MWHTHATPTEVNSHPRMQHLCTQRSLHNFEQCSLILVNSSNLHPLSDPAQNCGDLKETSAKPQPETECVAFFDYWTSWETRHTCCPSTKTLDRTQSDWWWLGFCSDWAAAAACDLSAWVGPDIQTWRCCGWRACSSGLTAWGRTRRSHGLVRHRCRCAVPGPGPGAYRSDPGHTGLWRTLWDDPSLSSSGLSAAPFSGTAHTYPRRATPDKQRMFWI